MPNLTRRQAQQFRERAGRREQLARGGAAEHPNGRSPLHSLPYPPPTRLPVIGDRMSYALEVIRAVDSPRVRILYDIYHMQIMEGDIIRTLTESRDWIGHYHTGGVPGRAEIDETQELYYPAIVRAIRDTGFNGYMAHEFIPRSGDPLRSLAQAVELCAVG